MSHAFADIAFTPSVKAAQQRDGSRAGYARNFEGGPADHRRLGPEETDFIAAQRSFYMATVSETGWPYVQHRGGPRGFLKVLTPAYRARPQRAMTIDLAGFVWNCPQHIPVRIDMEDVQSALAERDARIAELEAHRPS